MLQFILSTSPSYLTITGFFCVVLFGLGNLLVEQQPEFWPPAGAKLKNPAVPFGRRGF